MEITDKEVAIYRDIYYEHVKPLMKQSKSPEEIEEAILPVLVLHGWTLEMYQAFQMIDFMQRLAYLMSTQELMGKNVPNVYMIGGTEPIDCSMACKYPELRCPIRSEEKRNLN